MFSDAVLTTFITVTGAVLTAYITYRIKNNKSKPERVDTAFEMYEAFIKQQRDEIARLTEELIKERLKNKEK